MILVDSNVILDLVTDDPIWANWSANALEDAQVAGIALAINDLIYAEVSIRYERKEALDDMLSRAGFTHAPIPKEALFLAGKAFGHYRAAGGKRPSVLPDFFIGAHAAVAGYALMTRDRGRYRTYFPTVDLITP